jgi:hypothetical protein
LKVFHERGMVYSPNGSRTANSVKRNLKVRESDQFLTLSHGDIGVPWDS